MRSAETFSRFKFGGVTLAETASLFILTCKKLKESNSTPLNYFDNFYNAELYLREHGTYSNKVTDPIFSFANAIPRNMDLG